jgi:hypothetical protein
MRTLRTTRTILLTVTAAAAITAAVLSGQGPAEASQPHSAATAVTSRTYAATISIPASWRPAPGYAPALAYDGASGWVELTATNELGGLRHSCTGISTDNVLHPYGLHPHIVYRSIGGRPGCLIFPSHDAPAWRHNSHGPLFQQSSAVAEYRLPLSFDGTRWSLLEIDADPAHLTAIANSVHLHH